MSSSLHVSTESFNQTSEGVPPAGPSRETFAERCSRHTQIFAHTRKEASQEDPSRNAQLLTRAGFVARVMAGVYTMLPLGNRVLTKIERVIRREMLTLGAAEITMPALHPKENWQATDRWATLDVLFTLTGHGDREMALGPSHEEIVTPVVGSYLSSYRDLPTSVFQIQTKFRNEARPKSGVLRGREFRMKDLYSFHLTQDCLDAFYERVAHSYSRIFAICGLGQITFRTYATGGSFSKYSLEFQTVTPFGEDVIYRVPGKDIAINQELLTDAAALAEILPTGLQVADLVGEKAIEVGNIFKLGTRYSKAFGVRVAGAQDELLDVVMGCYGIGSSRLLGAVAECLSDTKGLVWPSSIAPFQIHLLSLAQNEQERAHADGIFETLGNGGFEVLYDDRADARPGQKFADSDLIGIPLRMVVSSKTIQQGVVEIKSRTSDVASLVPLAEFMD